MSTVLQGCACINEHGSASGGAPGNQTGGELRIRPWYRHEKGWVVIRAKNPKMRPKIAAAMKAACNNKLIGYDQPGRNSLYIVSKPLGFNPGRVKVPCSCDCSSLVRVCIMYALVSLGIKVDVPNFRTVNEPETLKATGEFVLLTDPIYTDQPGRLLAGDILCTPISGHTVIVLSDGDLAKSPAPETSIPATIKYRSTNTAVVRKMQLALNAKGYNLTVTGKFDLRTLAVLRRWQRVKKLKVDGECGPITWRTLLD